MTKIPAFTLYCDESGNTGGNFLDPNQPVYALAGWIVPSSGIQIAEDLVLKFERRLVSGESESKARTVLKTELGLRSAIELLNDLGNIGCLPTFSMAEKKYCIAAKIVETFLDPVHNDNVHPEFLWDTPKKQNIAELFTKLPQEKLTNFAIAYRDADILGLSRSARDISLYLNLTLQEDLADLIEGCLSHMDEIARLEKHSDSFLPNKAMQALNTPTAVQFFMMANHFGKSKGSDIRIVHDESFHYQDALREIFTLHKEAKEGSIHFPHTIISTGNKNLLSIEFVRSDVTPLVRAADILAGALTQYASKVIGQLHINPVLIDLLAMILPASLSPINMGWFMASNEHIQGCFDQIMKR